MKTLASNIPASRPTERFRTTFNDSRSTVEVDLQRVRMLADLLDNRFTLLGMKFGWDGIIGLLPGIGDIITTGLSAYTIWLAHQHGASRWTLTRMMWNTGWDMTVGAVPVVGDALDFFWKSNTKNLRLLEQHLKQKHNLPRVKPPTVMSNSKASEA